MAYDNSLIAELKKTVGWKNYWNLTDIPDLETDVPGITDSESGQYYQDFNGALRLNYILPTIDQGRTLAKYLDTVETQAINMLLNKIETKKNIQNVGKSIATSDVVFGVGRKTATITNQSRFNGVMFEVKNSTGIRATINRVGLYLTAAVTDLDLYLFHSSKEEVVAQFTFTTTETNSFGWNEISRNLDYDDGTITGGTWYLGYYQDDLALQASQAVQFTAMNWVHGYCNTCGQNSYNTQYKSISNRLQMRGFFVQSANLPVSKTERFEPSTVLRTPNNNQGFNFNITISCNLTTFWRENRRFLKKAIGYQVAMNVLKDIKYSMQTNHIEEALKIMIIRDLEGPLDTKALSLAKQLEDAIDDIILDQGNLNKDCLPCARKPHTSYGAIGSR